MAFRPSFFCIIIPLSYLWCMRFILLPLLTILLPLQSISQVKKFNDWLNKGHAQIGITGAIAGHYNNGLETRYNFIPSIGISSTIRASSNILISAEISWSKKEMIYPDQYPNGSLDLHNSITSKNTSFLISPQYIITKLPKKLVYIGPCLGLYASKNTIKNGYLDWTLNPTHLVSYSKSKSINIGVTYGHIYKLKEHFSLGIALRGFKPNSNTIAFPEIHLAAYFR